MRRELIFYKITLSNLINSTRIKLRELRFIIKYIKNLLKKNVKNTVVKNDIESLTNINHVKRTTKNLIEINHIKNIVEINHVKSIKSEILSKVFLKILSVYEYRYLVCDFKYY